MKPYSFKHGIKIAISLAYFALVTLVRGVLRLAGQPSKSRLVILYYHGVPMTYRSNFKRQMDALQRGARVIPACYRGSLPSGKYVAITFDDAFQSVVDNALPELAARKFHTTIFVPLGSLGSPPRWAMEGDDTELNKGEVVMTIEQLKALSEPLVSLGSHTISHPSMVKLDRKHVREEIEDSRRLLAELSGQDILSFSFPYGDHDHSLVASCKKAGYENVFSIIPEEVDTTSHEVLRGRTKVDPSDGPIEFFLKFNGAYVWRTKVALMERKLHSITNLKQGRSGHVDPGTAG